MTESDKAMYRFRKQLAATASERLDELAHERDCLERQTHVVGRELTYSLFCIDSRIAHQSRLIAKLEG